MGPGLGQWGGWGEGWPCLVLALLATG